MRKEIAVRQKSLLKGILAGLAGGLVATAARTYAERLYPPRSGPAEPRAPASIHWGVGALTGAAYGGLAEFYPAVTEKDGASFGMTLATLTQNGLLPMTRLSTTDLSVPTGQQTPREQTSHMASHMVYGIVTETVRAVVRRFL